MNNTELNENLKKLLDHLDSVKDTLPMVLLMLNPYAEKASSSLKEFIEENVEETKNEEGETEIQVNPEHSRILIQLFKNSEISKLAYKLIPQSLFVTLISQYDAYLNELLKILFKIRPEYINNSDRELSFSELNEFESIEKAREYIVEKEIETVLRKSHNEHFIYLEKKLSIPLRKELPVWKTFIEITERRNLLVHCDGVVSSQYIKVCKENKCLDKEIKLNQKLSVDLEYFLNAYKCLYEISTKLTHTIWRKLIIEDLKEADTNLNHICYDLITTKQFELADILLDFSLKQKKHYSDFSKNLFVVNKALSQYLQGNKENAVVIINSKDWSASSDDFKLGHLVITEKNEQVYELMKKIGTNGEVKKEDYKSWPLFHLLREKEDFKNTFKEIFNEDYKVIELPKRPVHEFMEEFDKKEIK